MIRRIIGLALGAFMLHLNVARADLACAKHPHDAAASAHGQHAPDARSHAQHHSMAHADHAAMEGESCQTPAQADCCQALVSCSVAFGLEDALHVVAPAPMHDRVLAVAQSEPISRVTAPEPPPPRA